MRKRILFFGFALMTFVFVTRSHAEIKTIKFAMSSPYAPFASYDIDEEVRGFDVDIVKEICKRIKATCTFSNEEISDLIPSLKAGKYGAWIGAIAASEERKKEIVFSDPYFSSTAKLLAPKTSTFSAAPIEIKGKTIGAESGSSFVLYLKKIYGNTIKIKEFKPDALYAALKKGEVDAIIDDSVVLRHWRSHHSDQKSYRLIRLPAKYHLKLIRQQYGVAIAKNNHLLLKAINDALAQIKSDGTYKKILDKHFD